MTVQKALEIAINLRFSIIKYKQIVKHSVIKCYTKLLYVKLK